MKILRIPKPIYDSIENHKDFTEKEKAKQIMNLCVLISFAYETKKAEVSFTLEEYAARMDKLISENYKIELVDMGSI